jgi:hypothetical protein
MGKLFCRGWALMGADKESDFQTQAVLQEVTERMEEALDEFSVSSVTSCKTA